MSKLSSHTLKRDTYILSALGWGLYHYKGLLYSHDDVTQKLGRKRNFIFPESDTHSKKMNWMY